MSTSQVSFADVIIIGAGLSGLQAARSLSDAGITTVVLEARQRVGGKTWSIANEEGDGFTDMGAEWLNDVTQPHVFQLARNLGLEFASVKVHGEAILQDLDGGLIRHPYGEQAPLPQGEDGQINQMKALFEKEYNKINLVTCHDCEHDDVTLDDFVRSHRFGPASLATVAVWTRVMLGCEPSELSAAYFFVYCKSQGGLMKMRSGDGQGRYLSVKTGTQSIAEGLAASLLPGSVRLGIAVKTIVQSDTGVNVYSADGHKFRGRKVIVAFSTPLYRKINFDPQLSVEKVLLTGLTRLGYYTKVMTTYDEPWWRDGGLCGASQSFLGPAAATRDTSNDVSSKFRLTSFITGSPGKQWSKLPPTERRTAILMQLSNLFGSKSALYPAEYVEQQWSSEEWSLGCPCPYMPPGLLTKVGSYLTEPHGHVHFVGTETAIEWKGYMEGALVSGMRGAGEVITLLRAVPDPNM